MKVKTKLFSSQFVVERDEYGSWGVLNKTEDVDDQVNSWVEESGNKIVGVSPPAMHAEWIDKECSKKTIIVSVMVMYTEGEGYEYPEFRESLT
jgi:hypothetical protein